MNYIHLTPDQVPQALLGGYNGRKFKVAVCERVHIEADAGTWHGGARDIYSAVRLADGRGASLVDTMSHPWDSRRVAREVPLVPGVAIIRHSTFNGKDMGLTFYILPADAAPLLPAPKAEMDPAWQTVLDVTRSYKSGYRQDEARRQGVTADAWKAAVTGLQGLGYLDTRGAITPAGRNAATARGY